VNGTNKPDIQGSNSFFSCNEPLFVSDGIPSASLSGIHAGKVKSTKLLKGAGAAIY
jgi:hypothetical protein